MGPRRKPATATRLPQRLAPGLGVAILALAMLVAVPAEAVRVRLRARTELQVQAVQHARQGQVLVRGRLVEVRGPAVAEAPVALVLAGEATQARVELAAATGSDGRFEVQVPASRVPAGETLHVEAHFAGDPARGEAAAELLIDLGKLDATLELKPSATRLLTDTPQLDVEIQAGSGDLPVAGAAVQLTLDGRPLLVTRTGPDGHASATLPVAQLGLPGGHLLGARLEETEQANAAQATVRLELLAAVEVSLTAQAGGTGQRCGVDDWCVQGRVTTTIGGQKQPVADAAVTLHADRHLLGSLVTDADGNFAAVLRGESMAKLFPPGPVGLVARAHAPAPWHDVGWSGVAVLDVPPPPGIPTLIYGVPLVAWAVVALWRRWQARERARQLTVKQDARSAGLPEASVQRALAGEPSCRVRGVVRHGETGRPAAATVLVEQDGAVLERIDSQDGTFRFPDLPAGPFQLVVQCPEHLELRLPIELPHDGGLDGCVLLPASCRAVVRGAFSAAVRRSTGQPVDWARETPREVEPRWASAFRRGHGEIRFAVRRVERVLYGRKTTPTDVEDTQGALGKVDEVQR